MIGLMVGKVRWTLGSKTFAQVGLELRGFPVENDLLAITPAQTMELNQSLTHKKNSSSLKF